MSRPEYELSYSVQIDGARVLELLVDEVETGDCMWQITNASGQVLGHSELFQDQARCLLDGLARALIGNDGHHTTIPNPVSTGNSACWEGQI